MEHQTGVARRPAPHQALHLTRKTLARIVRRRITRDLKALIVHSEGAVGIQMNHDARRAARKRRNAASGVTLAVVNPVNLATHRRLAVHLGARGAIRVLRLNHQAQTVSRTARARSVHGEPHILHEGVRVKLNGSVAGVTVGIRAVTTTHTALAIAGTVLRLLTLAGLLYPSRTRGNGENRCITTMKSSLTIH